MNNTFDDTQWDQESHSFQSSRKRHRPGSSKKKVLFGNILSKKIILVDLVKSCTSNTIQYLASIHTIIKQGKLHIKSIKSGNIKDMLEMQNQQCWTETRQLVANRNLTKWILHFTKPINTVDDTTFEDFFNYLNSNYKLPNEKNLKLLIHQAYDWTEESMKELFLSSAKYISLITDLWTFCIKQGYIGITALFMNSDFKIYDILLELEYLPYPHTAEHIRDKIQLIIEKWSLQEKVIAIVTDNGSNMIKAISYLNNITRIPCTAHTLQLAIGKGLAPALVFISHAKYLNWFFTYPKQIERLQTTQTSLNCPKILDVVCDDSTIRKDGCRLKKINFTEDEWIFMEHLVNLLGLFEEVTTFLSGSIYATLSLMHSIISELQKVFEDETLLVLSEAIDFPMITEGVIERIKSIIIQALHQYWRIPSDIALKAAFLDPRFKDLAFARDEKNRIIQLIRDELYQFSNYTNSTSDHLSNTSSSTILLSLNKVEN
ncbi:10728_t:CDS:2, partial [Ambispora gerdemannii]